MESNELLKISQVIKSVDVPIPLTVRVLNLSEILKYKMTLFFNKKYLCQFSLERRSFTLQFIFISRVILKDFSLRIKPEDNVNFL